MNTFSTFARGSRQPSEVAAAVPSGGRGCLRSKSERTGEWQRGQFRAKGTAARDSGGYRLKLIATLTWLCLIPTHAQTGPNDEVGPMAKVTLVIGKASLTTQVAATPAQEERGLMYVTNLPDNDGMIFLLPLGRAEFWMKNTLIPLSVAFIDKNGVILEIHDMQPADPHVPDEMLPRTRSDSDQVAYALETNLHWFSLNGIKPGEKIQPPPSTLGKPTN